MRRPGPSLWRPGPVSGARACNLRPPTAEISEAADISEAPVSNIYPASSPVLHTHTQDVRPSTGAGESDPGTDNRPVTRPRAVEQRLIRLPSISPRPTVDRPRPASAASGGEGAITGE